MFNIGIMKKKRTNYNLTEDQHRILRIAAVFEGISASKLLRRIIDEWIEANGENIQIQTVSKRQTDSSN